MLVLFALAFVLAAAGYLMAKPASVPTWATDVGAIADPGPARTATGFVTGKKAPAKWFNWLFNKQSAWLSYLNNLHAEPEFLNKAYAWTGEHSWAGAVAFDDLTVNNSFTAASGADIEGTIRVQGDVMLASTSGEVMYADAAGALLPRSRKAMVPLSSGLADAANPPLYSHLDGYWYWPTTSGPLSFPLRLPRGSRLENVTIGAANTISAPRSFVSQVLRRTANKLTPNGSTTTELARDGLDGTVGGNANFFAFITPNVTIDNTAADYWLNINAGEGIHVHWIELIYWDPGPRND